MAARTPFSELLARARKGDRDAREELFSRIADEKAEGARLLAVARRALPRDDRARELLESRDLVQSALRCGWADLSQFDGRDEREFLGWMRAIVRHRLNRHVRRKRPAAGIDPDLGDGGDARRRGSADARDPFAREVRRELRSRVRSAVEELPEGERAVIDLRLRGLKAPEIARRLRLSPAAVRKRESRAAARLRGVLGSGES